MRLGLTYADVLLVPKKTPLSSRSQANIKTRFSKNVLLNIPLISSNMASVTEHKMAIAMARDGGIGIIHQFLTIQEQAEEVRRVKRSTSFIIKKPIFVHEKVTLQDAVRIMEHQDVTSLLVKRGEELVGIFTSRDYLFEEDLTKTVSQVMTPKEKLVIAQKGISLKDAKMILHKHRIEKLPLIDLNGHVCGLITTQDIKKLEYWPDAARDSLGRLVVAAAVGLKDTVERCRALVDAGCDAIVIDIAHAHSDLMTQRIRELKKQFPVDVVAGNIATKDAAKALIEAGVDALKVGIGPSPVCTTRIMSGAGVPQLTAIMDVCSVATEYGVPVIADGGISNSGDLAKAIAAGASCGMGGKFWAGCDESPEMIIVKEGKRYKRYYGSASYVSNHQREEKNSGRKLHTRQDVFVEGVSTLVDYTGPVRDVNKQLVKGLKSGLSYCGARNIREMQQNAEFIQITSAGLVESKSRGTRLSE